jgi:hypothetical protein
MDVAVKQFRLDYRLLLARCVLILGGTAAAILLAEGVLRIVSPHEGFGSARELHQFRKGSGLTGLFTVDSECGFRPILGTDVYNEYGTRVNRYGLARRAGVQRVLFIGDSATARGALVEAFRSEYGDDRYEYWNAGVESFNTVQEVEFYRRFNRTIRPDALVLTFHMNDFETTPVAFLNSRGDLEVYAPNFPAAQMNPWLFKHSLVYRMAMGFIKRGNDSLDAVTRETRRSLAELAEMARTDRSQLTVLVLPLMKPYSEWTAGDQLSHTMILGFLGDLGIRHFDLLCITEDALRQNVNVCEQSGDDWHPSAEVCARYARYLHEKGIFDESR